MKPHQVSEISLYTSTGARKYLNESERRRVLAAAQKLAPDEELFALTLAWTGARVSEVLALTASSFQIPSGVVAIRTLKRRKHSVREVPTIPPNVMRMLDRHFRLSSACGDRRRADQRLWPWSRTTAWRLIKHLMADCGIVGRHACPRGLRHAFGVGTLQARVPLNITQRWMGHSRLSTTAIYAGACGPEERTFARGFWERGVSRRRYSFALQGNEPGYRRP